MNCYHCQLPVPSSAAIILEIDRKSYTFCCRGCSLVFQMIKNSNLDSYYQKRELTGLEIPVELLPGKDFSHFDRQSITDRFVSTQANGHSESRLLLEGVTCAACTWLIETYLSKQKGIQLAEVNYSNHRATISWDPEEIKFSALFTFLSEIGYRALPYDPAVQERQQKQLKKSMLIRLAVAGFCAGNIMMLSISLYSGYFSGMQTEFKHFFQWLSALLSLPAVLYSAGPFWSGAITSIKSKYPNMDLLISLGIVTTFSYSVMALLADGGETYFDSCTMLIFILLIGRTLESMTRSGVMNIKEQLLRLTPQFVVRLNEDGSEATVSADELKITDRIRIKPGDSIPVDGRVCYGSGEIDESALTGENQWRFAGTNDTVLSGTINRMGSFVMKADKVGQDSALQQIISLVDQVNDRKTNLQRMADKIAARFVWVVLFLSLATFVYWNWIAAKPLDLSPWLIAVSVIIIACPCALGLATPMTIMAATALAFKRRILIKSGEFFEQADKITDIAFDKTGTLTNGEMQVVCLNSVGNLPEKEWFSLAVQLEKASNHPIARAIRAAAKTKQIPESETRIKDFVQLPGQGVKGTLKKQKIRVGNARFVKQRYSSKPILNDDVHKNSILAVQIFVSIDNILQETIDLQDSLKSEAKWLIDQMKEKKLVTHLLSGDLEERVSSLSTTLGIDQAHGEMFPEEKLEYIQALQAKGRNVIMVGDGLNDAPALSSADIGIAVHNSTELSMDAADVVFLNSNLKDLVAFLSLSLNSKKMIQQNLMLALLYNACTLPLAMLGLVTPLLSAIFMASSSLVVTLNLLRLRID